MRVRFSCVVVIASAFFALGQDGGCLPPQRIAVSPDGNTMVFALNDDGGYSGEESSDMYALNVETGRLRMLTHEPGEEGWCTLDPSGETLMYMRFVEGYCVSALNLSDDVGPFPLAGALSGGAFPTAIPGGHDCFLLLRTPPPRTEGKPSDRFAAIRWELYAEAGKPVKLNLPADYVPIQTAACVAPDRFAVWMVGPIPDEFDFDNPAKTECALFVVDINYRRIGKGEGALKLSETTATKVAGWRVPKDGDVKAGLGITQTEAFTSLAFSADGKRLIAAVAPDDKSDRTAFVEIDPAGKAPMKTLFNDVKAWQPEWSPDASTVVYLRECPEDDQWRELVLRKLADGKSTVIVRLPGGGYEADTRLRWEANGDLFAYHLSNDGVRIVRVVPALGAATVKHLSREKLRVQRSLAQLEFAVKRFEKDADVKDLPDDVKKQLDGLGKAFKSVDPDKKPFEAAWDKVDDWVDVKSVPDRAGMAPISATLKKEHDRRAESRLPFSKRVPAPQGEKEPPADGKK